LSENINWMLIMNILDKSIGESGYRANLTVFIVA